VKLMDFGLARGFEADGAARVALTEVATMSRPVTAEGTIVGTLNYMAPEQLEGGETDARTDVWALGCVLYEMATGKRPFDGASQASLVAAIMDREPEPLARVQPLSPPALEHVVSRCLAKDPSERWQSARDVAHELEWLSQAATAGLSVPPSATHPRGRERLAWGLALVALAAAIVLASYLTSVRGAKPAGPMKFAVNAPEVGTVVLDGSAGAISPDGQLFVLTLADSSGDMRLWIRRLDTLALRPLAGSENATLPFWSPDSRHVGFFKDKGLWQVPVDGGPAERICNAPDGRGATWNRDGTILFAGGMTGSINSVWWKGSEPAEVVGPDTARGETGVRFPSFLPDGQHFLYVGWGRRKAPGEPAVGVRGLQVYVGKLGSSKAVKPLTDKTRTVPVFAAPDLLVFTSGDHLVAQHFDLDSLEFVGGETRIGDAPILSVFDGAPAASVAANGILAHVSPPPNTDLAWLDARGNEVGRLRLPSPAVNWYPVLSPDQKRVTVARPAGPRVDLFVIDLERPVAVNLTNDGRASILSSSVVWSPDSSQIAYVHDEPGLSDIYTVPVNRTRKPRPFQEASAPHEAPASWSPRYMVFLRTDRPGGEPDIWFKPLQGNQAPRPFLTSPGVESFAALSTDEQWLAYDSDDGESAPQIYVRSFPDAGAPLQASTRGGAAPQWSGDGNRLLFFVTHSLLPVPGAAYVVDIQKTPTLRSSEPRLLFQPAPDGMGVSANADFTRFLAAVPAKDAPARSFTVVVNWQGALRR
jgi:Tol biopolymer transport system component